ncbi:MAG: CRISPR system precrRNA processing endoribonuclease RAMP protein Cas6 [Chloroflexi bacterium]|nr:CRISPR system precrRNA processing endoribonuclease RAMP protein Cas6 [Chloroflexota bacterium]
MPLSLILYLDTSQAPPPGYLGREAQAWFLSQLQEIDPQLSAGLHDTAGHKPYTVSDVFALPDSHNGQPCFALRITAFEARLEELITGRLLKQLPDRVRIWYVHFRLCGYTLSPAETPWARQDRFGQLVQQSQAAGLGPIGMQFISPTGFRSEGNDILFPIPSHVYRGYWQKWNAFAPEPLHIDAKFLDFVQQHVLVSSIDELTTQRIVFARGKRGGATGFLGEVSFTLAPHDHQVEGSTAWNTYVEQLKVLTFFAFYCGTGHHTTIGLGQTYPHLSTGGPRQS